jgi:hypothetical protein
MAIEMSGSKE